MPTTLDGIRLEIVSPRQREVRLGDEVPVEVSLELADPWIELPRLGREAHDVSGSGLSSLEAAFETDRSIAVPALISGDARVTDTRIDVHTPRGFPDAGAGRGVEVTVRSGSIEVRYGHLARGTARSGPVRVGEQIGSTGNTGRCVDGCGRSFVVVGVAGSRARRIGDLADPIELELLVGGRKQGSSVRVPAGETKVRSLLVGRARSSRDQGSRPLEIEVRAVRRRSAIA